MPSGLAVLQTSTLWSSPLFLSALISVKSSYLSLSLSLSHSILLFLFHFLNLFYSLSLSLSLSLPPMERGIVTALVTVVTLWVHHLLKQPTVLPCHSSQSMKTPGSISERTERLLFVTQGNVQWLQWLRSRLRNLSHRGWLLFTYEHLGIEPVTFYLGFEQISHDTILPVVNVMVKRFKGLVRAVIWVSFVKNKE